MLHTDMLSYLCKRILTKINAKILSWRFRILFNVYRGKIRVDRVTTDTSEVGQHVRIWGSISCRDSSIRLGDGLTLADSAEISAEDGEITVGAKVSIGPRTIITTSGGTIRIGNGTSFFSDCIISGVVQIGAGCLFGKNVTILSSGHQIHGNGTIRENDAAARLQSDYRSYEPVIVGDDCWLGSNSVILPGVTLAKGIVVGANAVVTKDFPQYSIVAGLPAQVIGRRLLHGPDSA